VLGVLDTTVHDKVYQRLSVTGSWFFSIKRTSTNLVDIFFFFQIQCILQFEDYRTCCKWCLMSITQQYRQYTIQYICLEISGFDIMSYTFLIHVLDIQWKLPVKFLASMRRIGVVGYGHLGIIFKMWRHALLGRTELSIYIFSKKSQKLEIRFNQKLYMNITVWKSLTTFSLLDCFVLTRNLVIENPR
jgi:hypothetical protein